jgi:hypothetical protein
MNPSKSSLTISIGGRTRRVAGLARQPPATAAPEVSSVPAACCGTAPTGVETALMGSGIGSVLLRFTSGAAPLATECELNRRNYGTSRILTGNSQSSPSLKHEPVNPGRTGIRPGWILGDRRNIAFQFEPLQLSGV